MEPMATSAESTQAVTLRMEGEIDMHSIPRLEAAFADVVAAGGPISVDMASVTFIDSAGLHFLVRIAASMNGAGPLAVSNVPPRVLRVMEIVGMTELPSIELRNEV
jgi:anti-anti-sigma factor